MENKTEFRLTMLDFLYWKYISIRARIRRSLRPTDHYTTTQASFIVYNLNDKKLRQRLNKEGYQFFPALSDQEVHLLNMDEWERINREDES